MAQGVLPFKYEEEKRDTGMTGLAGLPVYLDLVSVMGLNESIERHLHIKQQSWTDRQTLLSLILTNLAGGDCVDDLRKLEGDSRFCKVLRRIEQKGMKRRERREMDRRWRKEQIRVALSLSSVLRYLSAFHDADQEKLAKRELRRYGLDRTRRDISMICCAIVQKVKMSDLAGSNLP